MKFRAKGFEFTNDRHVVLTPTDLLNSADTAIVADQWNLIGKLKMPAGVAREIGYGNDETYENALSRAYAVLKDTAAATLAGKLKFVILDEEQNIESGSSMDEIGLDILASSATDRRQQYPLKVTGKIATQDKYIATYLYPTNAGNGTLDVSACVMQISSTKYKADRY